MKKNNFIQIRNILLFAGLTLILSCKDDNDPIDQVSEEPLVTEKGEVIGSAANATIGASGGELQSSDGLLKITIPQGALSSETEISVQAITNQAPLGVGNGYRLLPEGTVFSLPVQLTFNYTDELLDGSIEDFLWIITQASDGSWNAALKSVVNAGTKTVTIETTHFSDWALGRFIDFTLNPASKTIQKGQSVQLSLTGFMRDQASDNEDELAPLIPITDAGDELTPLTPIPPIESRWMQFRIKQWTLNGAAAPVSNSNGSLSVSGKSATYTAPNKIPSPNPVAVTVELEASNKEGKKSSYMVTSSISVVETDLYVLVKIDGAPHEYFEYGVNGTIPPDPNNAAMVNCGLDDEGKLTIVCMNISPSDISTNNFVLVVSNPSEGTINLDCYNNGSGEDEMQFQVATSVYYELDYVKRTLTGEHCESEYLCGSASVTFMTYEGTGGIAQGYFSGTIYDDNPELTSGNKCQSSIPHQVEGEFRVKLIF